MFMSETRTVDEDSSSSSRGESSLRIRGRPEINPDFCKGCGYCIEFCPRGVLEFSGQINSQGYQYPRIKPGMEDSCVACGLCERLCPDYAIQVRIIEV